MAASVFAAEPIAAAVLGESPRSTLVLRVVRLARGEQPRPVVEVFGLGWCDPPLPAAGPASDHAVDRSRRRIVRVRAVRARAVPGQVRDDHRPSLKKHLKPYL